ncbi:hypothetical protein RvY_03138 [Ramazzottius varieornatus]|uniref:Uncharacterized protein n=1 Tax=Ramazzottius varieornatus TaxID=947166 RepID=A0A1D1UM29_RAMVA|nr:hypothetical protein RvY_03138 [Ramazzottius varieornatus]
MLARVSTTCRRLGIQSQPSRQFSAKVTAFPPFPKPQLDKSSHSRRHVVAQTEKQQAALLASSFQNV